ncbi:MAG: hypothetical protein ACFB16_23360 [Phormidesmis sp.]
MRKVQWIANSNTHHAVIVALGGYVNLVATKRNYSVTFVSEYLEETVSYSSQAKSLRDAKALSVVFGHSLLKDSGCYRSNRRSVRRKNKESELLSM